MYPLCQVFNYDSIVYTNFTRIAASG